MKIYLIERDPKKFSDLKLAFKGLDDVELVNNDFMSFARENDVQCVVSPANSFGLMDGGYDLALTLWYGDQLQERVQQYIIDNYYGEQPVGTSFIIPTNKDNQYLIHTPTMRVPERIVDDKVIYQCMRTTLIEAKKHNMESILIPMFGGSTGCVDSKIVAGMMRLAYDQLQDVPKSMNWNYANKVKFKNIERLF